MDAPEAAVIRQHLIDPEICIRCNTCKSTCPVGAITHDARNYVVDVEHYHVAWPAFPLPDRQHRQLARDAARRLPTAWRRSLGRDALPAELARSARRRGASGARWTAPRSGRKAETGRASEAAFEVSAYAAVIPPWSAASPYANSTVQRRRRDRSPPRSSATSAARKQARSYDTHHIVLDFGALPFPVLEGSRSASSLPASMRRDERITRGNIRSRARATASGPATTMCR